MKNREKKPLSAWLKTKRRQAVQRKLETYQHQTRQVIQTECECVRAKVFQQFRNPANYSKPLNKRHKQAIDAFLDLLTYSQTKPYAKLSMVHQLFIDPKTLILDGPLVRLAPFYQLSEDFGQFLHDANVHCSNLITTFDGDEDGENLDLYFDD